MSALSTAKIGVRAIAVAIVLVAGCHRDGSYARVSGDNHELRQAFNGDDDKVRVIMLVSPS